MAEQHERLVAHYRARLTRRGFKVEGRSPFVDYRPDIYATKRESKLFVEAEIGATLQSEHTLKQLNIMHEYASRRTNWRGVLLVPRALSRQAQFLLDSVFGDRCIRVDAIAYPG